MRHINWSLTLSKIIVLTVLAMQSLTVFAKPLEQYQPVLKSTLDKAIPVDYAKGYGLVEVKPNVFVITDGIWQSAFVVTKKGVVVLDAPESYGQHIITAVKSVTDQPIKSLVYTHAHKDHINGAYHLKDIPGLKIIAEKHVVQFLQEKNDPHRPLPTKSFKGDYTIKMGGEKIQLISEGNFHSNESDIFIYMPDKKFLMVIDSLTPGYVPFKGLDLTSNFHEYMNMFDEILAYDFDVFVGGHLGNLGTREDVELSKEYVMDLYQTVKRVHANTNMMEVMSNAAAKIGWDNKFLLFKVFLDQVVQTSAKEIVNRWQDRLANVDVWAESHADTALVYIRWDD